MKAKSLVLGVVALVFAGCRGEGLTSPDWKTSANVLTYSASTRVVPYPFLTNHPPAVEVTIVIANNTDRTITFNYSRGICEGLELRAYTTPDFSGTPAWVNALGANVECASVGYLPQPLAPRQSITVVDYGFVSNVLGSDKPAGTYYIEALVGVGGGYIRNSTIRVPAGSVLLAR